MTTASQTPWFEKVWGRTRELVDSPFYSRHELAVKAGGYCSLHYHEHRANRFIVVDAEIEVIEFLGPHVRRKRLGPQNVYDVPSLVPHLFSVYRDGTVYEEYYADRGGTVRRDDIVRLVEGGIVQAACLSSLPDDLVKRYADA